MSGAVPASRPQIPTHHQSLINTEFQGFVAGQAWAGLGLVWLPLLLLNDVLLDET